MEKLNKIEFYFYLLLGTLMLGTVGCGSLTKSKSQHDQAETTPGDSPKNAAPNADQTPVQSKEEPPKSNQSGPSTQPLEGTFLQVENRQSRVVIGPNLLLTTNLEFPRPSGNGTRLTPSFPQGLRYHQAADDYRAIGTYNDGTEVFKNIEIRVRLYGLNKLLDVTLVTEPILTDAEGDSSDTYVESQLVTYCPPFPPSFPCNPPLFPLPLPPSRPVPCPTPCPTPCPPRDQIIYVYRYERA